MVSVGHPLGLELIVGIVPAVIVVVPPVGSRSPEGAEMDDIDIVKIALDNAMVKGQDNVSARR